MTLHDDIMAAGFGIHSQVRGVTVAITDKDGNAETVDGSADITVVWNTQAEELSADARSNEKHVEQAVISIASADLSLTTRHTITRDGNTWRVMERLPAPEAYERWRIERRIPGRRMVDGYERG